MKHTIRRWWMGLGLVLALGAAGCGTSQAEAGSPAHAAVQRGAVLLDVRTPQEFSAGHLPGAINIPVDALGGRLTELDGRHEVVVYCRSGRRSAIAASLLREHGHEVIDIGPMSAW